MIDYTRVFCRSGLREKSTPWPRRSMAFRAPESAHQQRGESPLLASHWRSVAEGNCVVERRGGKQPEANSQSISKTMLNSIRPNALASLRNKGEAQNWMPPRGGDQGDSSDSERGQTVSVLRRVQAVVGDGMGGSWRDVTQGSSPVERNGAEGHWAAAPVPGDDRASIRAMKRVTTAEQREAGK